MLFGNRDSEKEIPAFSHINLSYEEKKNILSQLAYWMMKNNLLVIKEEQAIKHIGSSISGLRQTSQRYRPKELYQYFLERSGILRSPEAGYVDFIHKSFQEYLAAYEVRNQDDWGFIADKANDINWYETLILSMGFANINDSQLVIERILGGENNEKNIVIAAACGANAPRLTKNLRDEIKSKIEEILPPRSVEASERLSSAGEFVVPYLAYSDSLNLEERFWSLNTLRMISSTQALNVASSYLHNSAEKEEVELLGNMLESYTKKEILSVSFGKKVYKYLKDISTAELQVVPEIFLRIMWDIPLSRIGEYVSQFKKVMITGFQNKVKEEVISLFTGLKHLILDGYFDSVSRIKNITGQLVSLEIREYSKEFDFYRLNQCDLSQLERFHLFTKRFLYFSGFDCKAINNVLELGLYCFNSESEIIFEGFENFKRLTTLCLYHEEIMELGYSELMENTSLQKIELIVPDLSTEQEIDMLTGELGDIPIIDIKYETDVLDIVLFN